MDKEQLRVYLEENTNLAPVRKMLKSRNPVLLEEIENSWSYERKPVSFSEILYQYFKPTDLKCPYGNERKFEYYKTGYVCKKTCQCSVDKKKATMLEKYGVEHPLQSAKIYAKFKSTLETKYGCDKLHNVNVEKRKQTNLERYGAVTPFESEVIREKGKETHYKHHGVYYPTQTSHFQEIAKEYYKAHKDEILRKRKLANLAKNDPRWYDYEQIKVLLKTHSRKEVADKLNCSVSKIDKIISQNNWTEFQGLPSYYEEAISSLLDTIGVEYIKNDRKLIAPKELDFYIPKFNIAIEFNGLRWHGERQIPDPYYHLKKQQEAENKNVFLIHIFQDEWDNHSETARDIISKKLGKFPEQKVGARELKLVKVDYKHVSKFYDDYHLQKGLGSSQNWALVDSNDAIIAAMSWKRNNKKDFDWELTRFCVKPNVMVFGAAQKLFSAFAKEHKNETCITYSDSRWFDGRIYDKLGFKFLGKTPINYWYTLGTKRFHRLNFTKKKLVAMGHDKGKTEWQIMQSLGYDRIWDCGNKKWGITL